jgi:hypothetical protein
MPHVGGKSAKKTSSSSTTKRHFTVVMGNKEHGLYVSSSPSSAARKAVSKLCATDKKKKVQFQIREITQGSKKKTYGPYLGEIEKLKEPIELKGRVIKYKPVAKLADKKKKTGGAKKKGSILVVEAKDGKVSKKYITKKQADKHMKQRHKRLDKGMKPMDKSMKKLHKSMRGGAIYECKTKLEGTNHTFSLNKITDDEYIINLYYHDPNKNTNNTFSLKRLENENEQLDNFLPAVDAHYLCLKAYHNTIKSFLNEPQNKCNLSFIYSKQTESTMYRTFEWFLEKFIRNLPMVVRKSNDEPTLRINDTFVNSKTSHDEDGNRKPYPTQKEFVEQIMLMLNR